MKVGDFYIESIIENYPYERYRSINFVAFAGSYIAGTAILTYFDDPRPVLWSVFVREDFRREGIAKKLLDEVIWQAKRGGKEGIELTVVPSNKEAIALYESVGFRHAGDASDDQYFMSIDFKEAESLAKEVEK